MEYVSRKMGSAGKFGGLLGRICIGGVRML